MSAALAVAAALGPLACRGSPDAEREHEPRPVVLDPDSVAVVRRTAIGRGPLISGSLEPRERATLVAETAGALLELNAELGDTVRRGELLARIDPGRLADRLRSARAALRSARQAHDVAVRQAQRTAALARSGARAEQDAEIASSEAAAAAARVAEARAEVATLENELRRTEVRAPFSGVVSDQPSYEGDVVTAGTPVLTVIDPSSLRLEASVPAAHLPLLSRGTQVEFTVRGRPNESFSGSITRVAPAAERVTRQIPILVSIPNPEGRLLAGLFAEGRIVGEQRLALAVPEDAVDYTGHQAFVTALRDGKAARAAVEVGIDDPARNLIEIRSGLRQGEVVVTGPARRIASGTPVMVAGPQREDAGRDAGPPPPGDGAD